MFYDLFSANFQPSLSFNQIIAELTKLLCYVFVCHAVLHMPLISSVSKVIHVIYIIRYLCNQQICLGSCSAHSYHSMRWMEWMVPFFVQSLQFEKKDMIGVGIATCWGAAARLSIPLSIVIYQQTASRSSWNSYRYSIG